MIAALMLFAAGQVIAADGGTALVRTTSAVQVGRTLDVQRLEHATGAPGRAPFFRWTRAGTARVTDVRPDGTAEVAVISGSAREGDRIN